MGVAIDERPGEGRAARYGLNSFREYEFILS